jgi:hypothetical protein
MDPDMSLNSLERSATERRAGHIGHDLSRAGRRPPKSIRAMAYSHELLRVRKMNQCDPLNSAKKFPPEPD